MINLGLGTFEKSKEEIGSLYNQSRTSFLDSAHANFMNAWNLNPFSSAWRAVDQISAYQESNIYLNKDDLNKKYAGLGLTFKEDTREGLVNYLVERKELENKRSSILSRGPQGGLAKSFFFLESLGTSFLDPINVGASFIPIVGQAKFASMVARSGKNIARMKKGFKEGLFGNALVEPLVYGVAKSEQADYDAYDAFTNIALGGFIGSAAHVGFGRMGDFIAEKRGKPNIYQRLAAISPENQKQLLDYSVGKVLKGEPVDTGNLILEKTAIGDPQLNKINDQIEEFTTLYYNSLKNGEPVDLPPIKIVMGEVDIPVPKKVVVGDYIEFFDDAGNVVKRIVTKVSSDGFSVKVKIGNKEEIVDLSERSSAFINIKNPNYELRAVQTGFQRRKISSLKEEELENLRTDLQNKKRYFETTQQTNQGEYKIITRDLKAVEFFLDVKPKKEIKVIGLEKRQQDIINEIQSIKRQVKEGGSIVETDVNKYLKKLNLELDNIKKQIKLSITKPTIKKNLENKTKIDRESAKIYLQNIRNLQKTQRDLIDSKRIENDRVKLQEQSNINNRNTKPLTIEDEKIIEKNFSELELEAENMQQRTVLHQKQLGIKDEELTETMLQERAVIEQIDNSIKNKTKIREAIEAGTNCTKRNS